MKRTQKASWFVAGMLCAAILANTVAPAAAALVAKTIQVYTGIEVFVDDMRIDAGETHGNPDAFAYNGTTYVAVAAISKSLGENVIWDGANQRVYIGEHEGASYNLLSVCPPYQTDNYEEFTTVKMSGTKYANGFSCGVGYGLFNLNGMYDSLSFDFGHIDGEDMESGILNIYLDDELVFSLDMEPDDMPEHYEVPLTGAIQMKIEIDSGDYPWEHNYALANVKVF